MRAGSGHGVSCASVKRECAGKTFKHSRFPLALVQPTHGSQDPLGRSPIGETPSLQTWAQNLSWMGPASPSGPLPGTSEALLSTHPSNKVRLMRLKCLVRKFPRVWFGQRHLIW